MSEKNCLLLVDLWCQVGSTDEDRGPAAKQLVQDHVDLHLIEPEDLSSSVTSSGLVTLEQLVEAYKSQAIQAKKKFKASFARIPITCGNPTWKGANSATVGSTDHHAYKTDTLACPILLVGGRYTWTVIINNGDPNVWLGVALSTLSCNAIASRFAGSITGCFGFDDWEGFEYSGRMGFFLVRQQDSLIFHQVLISMGLSLFL
jgi:hypothetical protein